MARIAMIAFCDYPTDTRVRCEAEALVERGDEVCVVCPDSDALGATREIGGVHLQTVRDFRRVGGAGPLHYVRQYIGFTIAAGLRVARLHRQQRFDVVQVHTMPDFLVFAALVPKLRGARVILDVHDLMPELYASKFDLPESHWIIRSLVAVERMSIGFADRAIAVHRPHLDALVAHGSPREKFETIMNVPDPRFFRPRQQPSSSTRLRLVYHGMVGTRNGLDVAVRAAASARREIPDLELRIIGDGDDFPRVRALVDELGLHDVVVLEQGMKPIEEIVPRIAEAEIGIVPIVDDPFTQYMLPVKLLEYVALGIPAIVSSTSTVRAYFDDDMVAFARPGDPDDLARVIVELCRDPARRAALAVAANRFNEEHSWLREKETYYRLVDSLTASSAPEVGRSAAAERLMEVGTT